MLRILDQYKYSPWFLFVMALPLFLQNLWVPGFHMDGLIYAALSKNAVAHGHWLVPFLNENYYAKFFDHPPFYIMYQAVLFKLLGINWTVARLSNVLVAMTTIFSLRYYVKKFSSEAVAQWSAVILMLSMAFIRKSRFPNMDISLTLFSMISLLHYYYALKHNKVRHWVLVGVFLGIAFLTKGLPALFVPTACFLHLLWIGRYRLLLNYRPWLSVLIGLSIFSIWPLLLYTHGEIDGFKIWINKQFWGTVVQGRIATHNDYFGYIKLLCRETLPWFLLSLIGIFKAWKKEKRDHWFFLVLIWFLTVLLPFSMMKWKYSHYVLPLYPAMAMMAAYTVVNYLKEQKTSIFLRGIYIVSMIAIVIFIAFPVGTKIRRGRNLHEMVTYVRKNNYPVKRVVIVDNATSQWPTIGLISFMTDWPVTYVAKIKLDKIVRGGDLLLGHDLKLPKGKLIYENNRQHLSLFLY